MSNFYDLYFKLQDMELGNNVNDINAQNVNLSPIDGIDVGIRQQPEEETDELKYFYDPEKGTYISNRPARAGEIGFSPQGRIEH
jgi:hypothetical protein